MPTMLTFQSRIENAQPWRIDADGFLRVTARILKAGVFPYAADDVPEQLRKNLAGKAQVMERIPIEEISDPKALASFEGKPVIRPKDNVEPHDWRNPQNALKDGLTVGSIAGAPYADPSGMLCDLLIQEPQAIEDVKSGKLVEISAAYNSEIDPLTADDGQGMNRADAVQRALRGNHVLLLPEGKGRCGRDVRILNASDTKGTIMPFKVKIGNSGEFEFSTQADADAARQLVTNACNAVQTSADEEKKKLQAEQKNALDAAHAEGSAHLSKFAELEKALAAALEQVKVLTSEEHQEGVANERMAYHQDEEKVVAAAPEPDKLKAAIGNCKTLSERKKAIVTHVMNARKQDPSKLKDEQVQTAFEMLVFDAKTPRTGFTMPVAGDGAGGSGRTQRTQNADGTPKAHPYFRK